MRVDVQGQPQIAAALRSIDKKLRTRVLRKAVTAAAKFMVRRLKPRTPTDTGTLKKSHGQRVKTYRGSGVSVGVVGPRIGFERDGKRPDKYGWIVNARVHFVDQTAADYEDAVLAIVSDVIVRELRL